MMFLFRIYKIIFFEENLKQFLFSPDERNGVIYTVEAGNQSICTEEDAKIWSYDFHNCFIDRKYNDGGRDLNNIVDR